MKIMTPAISRKNQSASSNARKVVLTALLITIALSSYAQLAYQYLISYNGDISNSSMYDAVQPKDIEVDKSGNLIAMGTYTGKIINPYYLYAGYWANDH